MRLGISYVEAPPLFGSARYERRNLYQFSKDRLQILQWNEFVQTSVMAGVYKLEMKESEAELKQLLGGQRTATGKQRVQLLYLLKTGQAATVQTAAQL